jgi:alginate O-acetyltransferase complex protein AlgJ
MKNFKNNISKRHLIIILIFYSIISTPLVISILNRGDEEKLIYNKLPDFPAVYQKQFETTFGLRKKLVSAFYFFRMMLLNETYVNDKIITGKDGWLFYSSSTDGITIDDCEGKIELTGEELSKIKTNLEEQAEWLRKKNIPYILVICPSKHTIYAEYLPGSIKKGRTIFDQILDYLKKNSNIRIIDLRNTLLSNKKNHSYNLYYKTDTHWNSLGAFLAYQEIMRAIPNVDPLKLSDFTIKGLETKGRDIPDMIGLEKFYTDQQILFNRKSGSVSPVKMKSLMVFNDSYFSYMRPFFQNHFDTISERSHFWNSFDYKAINELKPEIVIYQLTERYEKQLLRDNPEEIKKAVFKLP